MQNRRRQAEWEQQALELVRRFQVEQAVSLYREHDRVVVAEIKDELTRGLLDDRQQAFHDGRDVVILAHRRDGPARFVLACRQARTNTGTTLAVPTWDTGRERAAPAASTSKLRRYFGNEPWRRSGTSARAPGSRGDAVAPRP
jgi:hypothetical protein